MLTKTKNALALSKDDIKFLNKIGGSYTDLVNEARMLVVKTELFKLKIAKLAIKACTIRHGGNSTGFYTLSNFAQDTGIPRKKLSEWVITYRRVVAKIEERIKTEEDWNTASRVSALISKENTILKKKEGRIKSKSLVYEPSKDEVNELYDKVLGKNRDTLFQCSQHLARAHFSIKQIESVDRFDNNMLFDISEKCDQFIRKAQEIQDITIKLIGESKDKPRVKVIKKGEK